MSDTISTDSSAVMREPDLTGRTLGDFQLMRKLGQGGMGQVYLAIQISLKRQVAVKILRPDLAANETALRRFKLEAEAVARINHANIVQVYACADQDGLHYMALEYVEGRNLRDYLDKKGPPELSVALTILRQIAAALQRASESGIVHRDIKPENILISRKGEVKVADFGLSRCFAQDEQPLNLTQSGVTMGTPLYMSPEQVQGQPVDPRSDIYSFGVTAFHIFAGEPPFKGSNAFEVALQHVQSPPPDLSKTRPDLPADLTACIMKMMAKQPEKRYQTPREILRDLSRIREGVNSTTVPVPLASSGSISPGQSSVQPTTAFAQIDSHRRSRGLWLIGLALLGVGVLVGTGLHWWNDRSTSDDPDGEPIVEKNSEPLMSPRERQIRLQLEDLRLDPTQRMDLNIELALLYVHEGRLNDADLLFRSTATPPRSPVKVSEVGPAIVMAYRDQELPDAPERSVELFNKALEPLIRVMDNAPTLKDKIMGGGPKDNKVMPIMMLRNTLSYELTQAIAKSLERNATNLRAKDKSLPRSLDGLRRMLVFPVGGRLGG